MAIGVCSWSLQPANVADLAEKISVLGLKAVQIALDPLRVGEWSLAGTGQTLARAGISIRSGMMAMHGEDYSSLESIRRTGGVRPDEPWPDNLAAAAENARIARHLAVNLVTLHAGFLPHDPADPTRALLLDRLRQIVDCFAAQGVRVAFETGQESAETLGGVLTELDRPTVGVNFDPANMILYAMGEPVAALHRLAPRVAQIHIKDAVATTVPGTWGNEVPVGTGQVDWPRFFAVIRQRSIQCDFMIEREAGDRRIEDIRQAAALVLRLGVDS